MNGDPSLDRGFMPLGVAHIERSAAGHSGGVLDRGFMPLGVAHEFVAVWEQ